MSVHRLGHAIPHLQYMRQNLNLKVNPYLHHTGRCLTEYVGLCFWNQVPASSSSSDFTLAETPAAPKEGELDQTEAKEQVAKASAVEDKVRSRMPPAYIPV